MGHRLKKSKPTASHGLSALKRVVSARSIRELDHRTAAVKDLNAWKSSLLNDLGGAENVSTQRLAIVDVACRTWLYLNHVDCWLMQQESLINKRARKILPIVRERQQLADSLARLLLQLGLDRVAKRVGTLEEHIEETYGDKREEVSDAETEHHRGDGRPEAV
jgi:hypothetical protein